MTLSEQTKRSFPDISIMRSRAYEPLFKGRKLPTFVKEFIIRKFTNNDGTVGENEVKKYLKDKMPDNAEELKQRLLNGESVTITTRFTVETDMARGKVRFKLGDLGLNSDAFISPNLLDKNQVLFDDCEHWGSITLVYVEPEGRKKGYVLMTAFVSFNPYTIDEDTFFTAREDFSVDEWIDLLIAEIGYNPDEFKKEEKLEIISRMLVFVEPRLNMIELGPKSTGKSHLFNNLSKYGWLLAGGRTSRAKLFYNKATKQFGVMKNFDVVGIDEITTFQFSDPEEMQSIMKSYLEAGQAAVDSVMFKSECGLILIGNIPLDERMQPINPLYVNSLPEMFRESATMDRFHGFIEGWKIPRINNSFLYEGWALNSEYFSSILHLLRFASEYDKMFDDLVVVPQDCDLRDKKAVQRLTTAYHKLLFPHIRSLGDIEPEQVDVFKRLYDQYCLQPAMYRRQIIRTQCHRIDKEFKPEVSMFTIFGLLQENQK